jgi:Domain of unknown function (DUF4129)
MESNRVPGAGRALLTTLGVLVALAVVAVASRGSTDAGTAETAPRPSDTVLDILFTLYLLLLVVGAIFFVYLLALQKGVRRRTGQPGTGLLGLLVYLAIFLLAVAGARRLHDVEPRRPTEEATPPVTSLVPPETAPTADVERYDAEFAWIPALAVVGLLVAAVFAVWWGGVRRRRARTPATQTLGEALADVLAETLDDLRAETDPRRAVIAAYARLERALAARGVPRRAADTPLEYLSRVLGDLSVSQDAVRELTLLFERAKFSQHDVGEAMKEQAIAALQAVQDELRAAEALAQQERERAAALAVERLRSAT